VGLRGPHGTRAATGRLDCPLRHMMEVRFVLFEHRGSATYYRINDACVDCFPTAADIVMGRPVPTQPDPVPTGQS
jgi:hypothetical protein